MTDPEQDAEETRTLIISTDEAGHEEIYEEDVVVRE